MVCLAVVRQVVGTLLHRKLPKILFEHYFKNFPRKYAKNYSALTTQYTLLRWLDSRTVYHRMILLYQIRAELTSTALW